MVGRCETFAGMDGDMVGDMDDSRIRRGYRTVRLLAMTQQAMTQAMTKAMTNVENAHERC